MGRRRLLDDPLESKRRRLRDPSQGNPQAAVGGEPGGLVPGLLAAPSPGPGSPALVEAALRAVTELFPAALFGGSLPPLVLRHQLYSVLSDRTAVDRHLNRLSSEGRIRLLHLGLGPDALGVVFSQPYRDKVLGALSGTPRAGLVGRFLGLALGGCGELSYQQGGVRAGGLSDRDVTALVGEGLLTVRGAGSWWVALPGVGRFVRELLRGRRAILGRVRRARHRELPLGELLRPPGPPGTRLGLQFLLHDLLGAQLLIRVPTPSGPMLRLAEP